MTAKSVIGVKSFRCWPDPIIPPHDILARSSSQNFRSRKPEARSEKREAPGCLLETYWWRVCFTGSYHRKVGTGKSVPCRLVQVLVSHTPLICHISISYHRLIACSSLLMIRTITQHTHSRQIECPLSTWNRYHTKNQPLHNMNGSVCKCCLN